MLASGGGIAAKFVYIVHVHVLARGRGGILVVIRYVARERPTRTHIPIDATYRYISAINGAVSGGIRLSECGEKRVTWQ